MEEIIEINGVKYQKMEAKTITEEDRIVKYINDNPLTCDGDKPIIIEGGYIKIELPLANRNWTFCVWNWVVNFVKEFPNAYPIHKEHNKFDFQYIDIGSYLY